MTPIPTPDQVNLVLYHRDLDGFAAAWAAWKRLGDKVAYSPVQYGGKLPEGLAGKHVAVVDFSFKPSPMDQLVEQASSLIVLDHHKTILKDFPEGHPNLVLDLDHSGAVLSWEWFHPGVEVPPALLFVQDYDLWQWKLDRTRAFYYGTQGIPWKVEQLPEFDLAITTDIEHTLLRGTMLCDYVDLQVKRGLRQAVLVQIHPLGIRAWMYNGHVPWYSELGNALARQEGSDVDVSLVWTYLAREKVYACSLRSQNTNSGELARSLGGGGHPQAGGFTWRGTIEELFSAVAEDTTTSPDTART